MIRLAAFVSMFLVAACACGGKTTTPGPTEPGPTEPGPTDPGDPVLDISKLGESCAEGGTCAAGIECVSYFGIAGPSGPEFKSCEISCAGGKSPCPAGTACITIADGPGQVCRPAEPAPDTAQ